MYTPTSSYHHASVARRRSTVIYARLLVTASLLMLIFGQKFETFTTPVLFLGRMDRNIKKIKDITIIFLIKVSFFFNFLIITAVLNKKIKINSIE